MPRQNSDATPSASITGQAWLAEPALGRLFDCLDGDGQSLRIVGGAVRNALLNCDIEDIDLATPLHPDDVMTRARKCGLAVHPTGLAHGTITVISDNRAFEVTTLRRDVETFGRHAVVAFTDDWAADARRRDFTINALYADRLGRVFDYVGGLTDIRDRRVRFIGDAELRIREDYLRILRFFRFTAIYGAGIVDRAGLTACARQRDGLSALSAERVWAETAKLLLSPHLGDVLEALETARIYEAILPFPLRYDALRRVLAIDAATDGQASPVARLAAFTHCGISDVARLAETLRLSNRERDTLRNIVTAIESFAAPASSPNISCLGEKDAKALLYRMGASVFADAVRVAWAIGGASTNDGAWHAMLALPSSWQPPQLPVSGQDFIDRGMSAGPIIGRKLAAFERAWIAADFPMDAARIRQLLDQTSE